MTPLKTLVDRNADSVQFGDVVDTELDDIDVLKYSINSDD